LGSTCDDDDRPSQPENDSNNAIHSAAVHSADHGMIDLCTGRAKK